MPIKFACPAGHLLNVADRLAGREVRCLRCGKMVPVPLASSPSAGETSVADAVRLEPVVQPVATEPRLDVHVIEADLPVSDVPQPKMASVSASAPPPPSGVASPPIAPTAGSQTSPPAEAPPVPRPPALPGYECPARERNAVLGIAWALGAVAFSLAAPALYEITDHLGAASSSGVARWAFALLALAALHVAYAIYVWQVPDWGSVFMVALVELVHAMTLAFALGLLLASKTELAVAQWLDLADAARSDLARLWCFFALALSSAVAFLSGRYGLAWRRRLAA